MALLNIQPAPQPQSSRSPRPQPARPVQQPASDIQPTSSDPPSLTPLSLSDLTPQERARYQRHQVPMERAARLLQNSAPKITQFRSLVSSYRFSSISASDFISAFFSLFDCPSEQLGILVRELADLYEETEKSQLLLAAWKDWHSINQDYPSLPGSSANSIASGPTSSDAMGANVSIGRRVLKLKSSTQQSSRSSAARQASWGNILSPSSSSSNQPSRAAGGAGDAFPSLPAATRKPNTSLPITWASSTTPTSSTTSTTNMVRSSSSNPRRQAAPGTNPESFPSLPAANKPNISMAGRFTRPTGIRSTGTTTPRGPHGTNHELGVGGPWGPAPTPAQAAAAIGVAAARLEKERNADDEVYERYGRGNEGGEGLGGGSKKKGGKKGKGKGEMLFHFG